jgi:AcrR family transcriptional regulator
MTPSLDRALDASEMDDGGAPDPSSRAGKDRDKEASPRRSGLMQERSRRTRRQLVEAALRLWTERGFDAGIEETTVEEIAQAAGVTKGTFYFHFAHKEDILLELGFETSQAMFKEASAALASDASIDDVLDGLLGSLARRVSETPRAAVARTLREFSRHPVDQGGELPEEHFGFDRTFAVVFFHAQQAGQLSTNTDARVLGETLSAMTMGAVNSWIFGQEPDLAAALQHRGRLLIGGVRQLGNQTRYPA